MSPELEGKKILVVEDELDLRIFLCNLLGNCGYQTIDAVNRAEGLQKAKTENPALIILDVMIPREGGIHMYRDLKQDQRLKNIPVIMISTIDMKTFSFLQRFRQTPKDKGVPEPGAYLEKPLEVEELIRLVRSLTTSDECPFGDDDQ